MKKPTVDTYMTTKLVTLNKDMNVYFAIGLLLNNKISGAPVIDEENKLIGVLSEKDCLRIFADDSYLDVPFTKAITQGRGTVEQFMTTSIYTVNSGDDLFTVANIFLKNNFRRLPVMNGKKIVGQISRRDVLKAIKDIISYKE